MGMRVERALRAMCKCYIAFLILRALGMILIGVIWFGILDLGGHYIQNPPALTMNLIEPVSWVFAFITIYDAERKEGSL